jgi:uncharacterized protein (TIGR02271 family)
MTDFDVDALTGAAVVDGSGGKIGKVAQVYLDDRTGQPQWVTVRTGLFGTRESFVPLAAARFDGDRLVVDASKDRVSGAPQVDEDGHISGQQEAEIYRYYGLSGGSDHDTTTTTAGDESGSDSFGAGHDTSGPDTDGAMTRSEERLVAGTRKVETERVRLRKYVVTEMVTVEVPVRREEVRLEHEPITDAQRDAAYASGSVTDITEITDATDEEREIILHAERPVVTTETVAVERVRLGKDIVTDTETVAGEVRKEQIELDDPPGTAGNPH